MLFKCPGCGNPDVVFYYSNPDDFGVFCEKCNKEYPESVSQEKMEQ